MYGIYCTKVRGCKAARGLSAINTMHPECVFLYPVGTATMDMHRTLEKKERQAHLARNSHTKPLSESALKR